MPQRPSGSGIMLPEMVAAPCDRMVMKASRSSASAMAFRSCRLSNGGRFSLTRTLAETLVGPRVHTICGAWLARSFMIGTVISPVEVRSNTPARRPSTRVRAIFNDRKVDRVKVWEAFLPVVGVANDAHLLVALEFDELERAGADGAGALVLSRDMTGI